MLEQIGVAKVGQIMTPVLRDEKGAFVVNPRNGERVNANTWETDVPRGTILEAHQELKRRADEEQFERKILEELRSIEAKDWPNADRSEYPSVQKQMARTAFPDLPEKIIDAAILVERYFKSKGCVAWALNGIQSRNRVQESKVKLGLMRELSHAKKLIKRVYDSVQANEYGWDLDSSDQPGIENWMDDVRDFMGEEGPIDFSDRQIT